MTSVSPHDDAALVSETAASTSLQHYYIQHTSLVQRLSCDVMLVELPGTEGQNKHAVGVFTAHAHGITIDTAVTQWMPALQNQRHA